MLKVERYKKIDFPKISFSKTELERYLNNEDSTFDIGFENPFPDELQISFIIDALGDATTPPATEIILKPLGITKTRYTHKGNEGSEYTRTPEDNFEVTVTGGDKIDMEKLVVNGELKIPNKGRVIYVKQLVDLEDVIEN